MRPVFHYPWEEMKERLKERKKNKGEWGEESEVALHSSLPPPNLCEGQKVPRVSYKDPQGHSPTPPLRVDSALPFWLASSRQ